MPLLADSLRNLSASLIVMALTVTALVLGRDILIPLAVATIIAFVLAPVVRWLAAWHLPPALAATSVLVLAIVTMVALSFAFSAQMLSLTADLDSYKENLIGKVRTIADLGRGDGMIRRAMAALETLGGDLAREVGQGTAQPDSSLVVRQQTQRTATDMLSGLGAALGPLAQIGLTVIFALFLLLQHHDLRDRVVKIAGTDRMSGTAAAISDAGSRLSQLFLAQAVISAAYGIFIGAALWIIGVPNPLVWGIVAFLMRFVPFVGSIIAAVPPIVLAAAVDPGWGPTIATALLFLIGEAMMGNVVEPMWLGRKAGLTAFGMIVAAAFWTIVWGPIGLLLAAPLTTAVVVFGRHIRGLEFISVLFGDAPALDPAQELYHRLLAGDPVAAASTLADEADGMASVDVSDRLVLPALRLAAQDHRAHRVDTEQAENLRETMREASDLFFEAPDEAPQQGAETPPIVCVIPARGVVDRAAAEHIALLVGRRTPCRAVVATHSSGLTAIADLRAMKEYEGVDSIVIATVGGVDEKQLRLIAHRAARTFPEAHHFVLTPEQPATENQPAQRDEDGRSRLHATIAPIVAALDCAPRRTVPSAADTCATPQERVAEPLS